MENFVVCISNEGYPASLESRKIYGVIPDAQAESRHYLRVMDETGEDYLYPEKLFLSMPLPENVEQQYNLSLEPLIAAENA